MMSEVWKQIGFSVATLFLITFSLTGCAPEAREISCDSRVGKPSLKVEREVALVLSPTDNFIDLNNLLAETSSKISDLLNSDGTKFSIVLADATPSIVAKQWVDFSGTAFDTDRQEIVDRATNTLKWAVACATGQLTSSFSVDPEVDLLSALQVASDSFEEASSEKFIFVISNGTQTAGQFSMTKGLPVDAAATAKLVSQLSGSGAAGDLKGATIFWSGLGQFNEHQPQPNRQSKDALVLLWSELVLAADGNIGEIQLGSTPSGEASPGSIPVSQILWLDDACVSITVSGDRGFSFEEDSATFLDLAKARSGARDVASEIKGSDCSGSLTVTGFTASGVDKNLYTSEKKQANQSLSFERARAFADLLKQEGVSVEIKVIGAGKGPIYDWDAAGNLVEKLAAQNRIVVVTQN